MSVAIARKSGCLENSTAMVKLKTATKWLILKGFQHVIECLLHISGLIYIKKKGELLKVSFHV
jgi:hypothetical protein